MTSAPPEAWLDGKLRQPWLLAIVLAAAVAATYANSLDVPFQFDDFTNIAENRGIRWLVLPADVKNIHINRPVGRWSLWLNYATTGLNITGFHVLNVAIHIAATLALFGLARRALQLPAAGARLPGEATGLAFCLALLWGLHPLQTQSVTYLIQRFESLMGLFFLLALYCLVRIPTARRPGLWQIAAIGACWLSVGSKEVGVAAPLVALCFDRVLIANSWGELVRRRWWMYGGMAASIVWLWFALKASPAVAAEMARCPSSWEYFRSQPGVILHYLRLTIWPHPLVLDYHWPVATGWLAIAVPGAILLTLFVASLVALVRWPAIGLLGFSFFVILGPTSSILPIFDLAFEHRMYLPLAVPITLAVLGIDCLLRHSMRTEPAARRALLGGAAVVAVLLAVRTHLRNEDWRDPVRLWASNVTYRPASRRGLANLAKTQLDAGQLDASLASAAKAVALAPEDPWIRNIYGIALLKAKRYAEARQQFEAALRLQPAYLDALCGLAQVCEALEQPDRAERGYRRAIELKPDHPDAHDGLARLLAHRGEDALAIRHFRRACEYDLLEPQFPLNAGAYHARRGQFDEAVRWFQESIRRQPAFAQGHLSLGLAHLDRGDLNGATRALITLRRLVPNSQAAAELLREIERREADLEQPISFAPTTGA